MKVLVIGGVAAGPKAASRIARLAPDAEITLIEKKSVLSYAGCGLPYFISGDVREENELMSTGSGTLRDSAYFKNVKNVNVLINTEALSIDKGAKTVNIRKPDGIEETLSYDRLVLATGASPVRPPIPGIDLENIFQLHTIEDAVKIREAALRSKGLKAAVIGGGLIGVETAESLKRIGCEVTMIELLPHILPVLDPELAILAENHMKSKGVKLMTGTKVTAFEGDGKLQRIVTDKGRVEASLAIVAVGVRPNIKLAKDAGLAIGETGAIKVDEECDTSDPDIYAVGDCAETVNLVSGKACYVPLGSTANKQGRVAANNICGIHDFFRGVLGSTVCRIFDFTVARTGLGEKEARDCGFNVETCFVPAPDKPHFMPGVNPIFIKLVGDRDSGRLLGMQAVGPGDAVKRTDAAAAAISGGMKLEDMSNLDLCYAPPYSSAVDNLITAANVLRNKIAGGFKGISAVEVKQKLDKGEKFVFLDVRSPAENKEMRIDGSLNIPLGKLRERLGELDGNTETVAFCKVSLRGYEAALMLRAAGFENVKVMEGGLAAWPYKKITGQA